MYERMPDKQQKPTREEFVNYMGNTKALFEQLNAFLSSNLSAEQLLRFPYGNNYGWGIKYFIKSKHICDIFAEKDAFSVMLRLTNAQLLSVYDSVSDSTKQRIDSKYPCGEGGWINCRILNGEDLRDIETLLQLKAGRPKK